MTYLTLNEINDDERLIPPAVFYYPQYEEAHCFSTPGEYICNVKEFEKKFFVKIFNDATNNKKIKMLKSLKCFSFTYRKDICSRLILKKFNPLQSDCDKDLEYKKIWYFLCDLFNVPRTGVPHKKNRHLYTVYTDFIHKNGYYSPLDMIKLINIFIEDTRKTMASNLEIKYRIYNQASHLPALPKEMINKIFKFV